MIDSVSPTNTRPVILFVDDGTDTPELTLQDLLGPQLVDVRLRHPEDVSEGDLERADLIVVDYFLASWPERDNSAPARAPRDGLAVAGTLRSLLLPPLERRTLDVAPARTVAFALWSAHLEQATFRLPVVLREHVFAQENNLEWAFDRDAIVSGQAVTQLADLAHAVRLLPERWPGRNDGNASTAMLMSLLTLPGGPVWSARAAEQGLACRPPVFELSERSHGLVLLRWLLHRVLPYPTFLIDETYLRARLRLDALPEQADAPLWLGLADSQYGGILSRFAGRRWWRAGVEQWLWDATDGRSGDPLAVQELAVSLGGTAERAWRQPVVVIGPDYRRSPTLVELEQTVRLRPDDWPPYADDAYAELSVARSDPALAALVDASDQYLLKDLVEDGDAVQ